MANYDLLGGFLQSEQHMRWVAYPYLPQRGLAIIGAPAKAGKTIFTLNMCYAWASGSPFLHRRTAPMRVLYVDREMGPFGIRERLQNIHLAAGEPLALENLAVHCRSRLAVSLEIGTKGYDNLRAMIGDLKPAVVVLDPLRDCFTGDENDSAVMTRVFAGVFELMDEFACAAVLVHHCGKGVTELGAKYQPDDPYKMRGSSRIFDVGDAYMMLEGTGQFKMRAHFTLRYHSPIRPIRAEWADNEFLLRWPDAAEAKTEAAA